MNVIRLPMIESQLPKSDPVRAVFRIFSPPIPKSVLEHDRETRLLEEIARLTPPNTVLRTLAAQCTPPEDVVDFDEGNARPW